MPTNEEVEAAAKLIMDAIALGRYVEKVMTSKLCEIGIIPDGEITPPDLCGDIGALTKKAWDAVNAKQAVRRLEWSNLPSLDRYFFRIWSTR